MNLTINDLISSIADQLTRTFPAETGLCKYPIRKSPTLDTTYPCFFVFVVNPSIDDEPGGTNVRETRLDIVFVQERNVPDQNDELYNIMEKLDEAFDFVEYTDKYGTCLFHVYERNSTIEDQELHYKFTIRQRVWTSKVDIPMQNMEEANVEIK